MPKNARGAGARDNRISWRSPAPGIAGPEYAEVSQPLMCKIHAGVPGLPPELRSTRRVVSESFTESVWRRLFFTLRCRILGSVPWLFSGLFSLSPSCGNADRAIYLRSSGRDVGNAKVGQSRSELVGTLRPGLLCCR